MHREIPIRLSHQARGAVVFVRCLLMQFISMCRLFREKLAILDLRSSFAVKVARRSQAP
jgi:hypothetical protein